MTRFLKILLIVLIVMPTMIWAAVSIQDDNKRRRRAPRQAKTEQTAEGRDDDNAKGAKKDDGAKKDEGKPEIKKQIVLQEDTIPDSLLHPRWKIQRTTPITYDDLSQGTTDLKRPENLKQEVEYNDTLNSYVFGNKIGNTWISAPVMMNLQEYQQWVERQKMSDFFRTKNDEIYQAKGKDKFSFTDMHFELGPAEKIFGPGGVRIKTQGTAELKFGATLKSIDNPSLPIRNRNTTSIDFDEKINLNVNGKVGDKVNMNLNYNTDATFDFDAQNMKLKYEGKEDEIVKLVEAGNVSFPSNSSLISGASSLFGIRTDLQFGKLKLQTVLSQKKSNSNSVSTKGGSQFTPFEIDAANYEENRHFFLSQYFRSIYDKSLQTLPTLATGVNITRVEIWVTNKSGQTTNTRNIIALTDLAEGEPKQTMWSKGSGNVNPSNDANSEFSSMVNEHATARDIASTATELDGIAGFEGGVDYEKLEKARLLNSSEYTLNTALGYVSLKSSLQTDQVLAVAYEYTYGGVAYQVGEFSADQPDVNKALFVKSLKNTSNNPSQGNWPLMMKNVYYLASSVEKSKFKLDVKFQSDTAGVYVNYIPETQVKSTPLIRVLGADRLDNNNKANPNGYFDYVEGYTVSNGRVFLPKVEPFGRSLYQYLVEKGVSADQAAKYAYTELYDSTKTVAKQIAEKDKYMLQGQFKGTSASVISLGAYNIPQGSVTVTAGGRTLTEGSDYSVDYSAGEVTILNQSLLDSNSDIHASYESNTDYGQQRKTMFGINWEYDFSKYFQISGTLQHLSEQSLTTKVQMGSEPVSNTLWGFNMSWKKESQWLTNMLNKIPFLHVSQPSMIEFNGEFAQLIAGQASGTQDNASYIDDFEDTNTGIDISTPSDWTMSSVPSSFSESSDKTGLTSGYNRARLAWYTIDPLFTRRSSTLVPANIKNDPDQLSNHYVREVYSREVFPNRDQNSYSGTTNTLSILNMAYYPEERGPYNFTTNLDANGHLTSPQNAWGGMMRKLDTNDFEAANIEYIEFWMLDPFIYTREEGTASQYGGDLYFNLGDISEDVLHDGKKFYESGMPTDGSAAYTTSQWGRIPTQSAVTYAFANSDGARALQDVGYNGLTDNEEKTFTDYQSFLNAARANVTNQSALDSINADPAADDYCYFRGSELDQKNASILERYKYINNPQGNSPESDSNYDTSYKTTPDVEDINQDFTLNEYEKYYQYKVSIRPEDLVVGNNYIVDKRTTSVYLRNGKTETVNWYQFRIPLKSTDREKIGSISDFTSIRFMRMFMTHFQKPVVLRFANLDLVYGTWRVYEQNLNTASANTGQLAVSAVNIEENSDKTPVNYVLPPGITRVVDPSQPQLTESNEQAMNFTLTGLSQYDAKAVYKNMTLDMRQYKHLQMFVHANAFDPNTTNLQDDELALFVRLGSDYKSNYYEYEIPLKLTAPGKYSTYSGNDCRTVWPEDNMLDINLALFTALKKARNLAKNTGIASYNIEFSQYDEDHPKNKITIMGNPTLGEVKTMVIGVRNLSGSTKSGEVWVNELRLQDPESSGGWAASGKLHVQLSDFGDVDATGRYTSEGFGGLEDGVASRSTDNYSTYSITTNFELGKFFPEKAKVSIPLYYSYTKERTAPKYNPLDTDMKLDDALDAAADKHERDSIEGIAVTKNVSTNFSLSGVKVGIATKRHPMPYDPANFTFSYSHSHTGNTGETTVYENEDNWLGRIGYSWTPVYKSFEPFKKIKSKSKYYDILKRFGLNWLPQNITFNTEMTRYYYELQERDLEDLGAANSIPVSFSSTFRWNRDFSIRWDITKNLHLNFQSATHAEIEQPNTPINKDLYPEQYQAWKDSVWTSIRHMGAPLDYQQTFTASYKLPLNLIPIFDWLNADAQYTSNYNWQRGTTQEDGTTLGNTIAMHRTATINGTFNLEKLYNHVPFLKKVNERFKKAVKTVEPKKKAEKKPESKADDKSKDGKDDKSKDAKAKEQQKKADADKQKALAQNKNRFEKEVSIKADTSVVITHGKKSKRLTVTARNESGKIIPVKYKVVDDNKIKIINNTDSAMKLKVVVMAKPALENQTWYSLTQSAARLLMMVRNVSFTYRNQYSMSLPGFMPSIGDVFGQKSQDDALSPGLGFAFGFTGDDYVDKAKERGWLLDNSDAASPATTNKTEDLQVKMTLEPARNLKIDLNATRNMSRSRSVQYMYEGTPTTLSGSFTMTTIAIKSSFEGMGNASNGYHSATFEKFRSLIPTIQARVNSQYPDALFPVSDGQVQRTSVKEYSADVLVPAFLSAYTGGNSLGIFPALSRLLPNWSIKYSGLSKMTFFQNIFKSVNLSHAYKCTYSVGSYSSYSTYREFMGYDLGFIKDATTEQYIPNSIYNVSQVVISESFAPVLGVDVTMKNNMTVKLEYRTQRMLSLSMTSVQLNETSSKDWTLGFGYKINDFNFFSHNNRIVKSAKKKGEDDSDDNSSKKTAAKSKGKNSFNHDLNIRFDMSLRNQAALIRDIASGTSTASSGNKAFKMSLSADYTLSKLLTLSFYYDRQTNTPLLTSSSYPTTTHDFGLSMKFSLTR